MTAGSHQCRFCGGCDCTEPDCTATCDWDCGCPDYPPPEYQLPAEATS